MKKKILTLLLVISLILSAKSMLVQAETNVKMDTKRLGISASIDSGDFSYYVKEDGTLEISSYKGKGGQVVVPAQLDGKYVTKIGDQAFEREDIESVIISEGITEIGNSAFYLCMKLKSVTLPESLESIDSWAFSSCTSLETINIPKKITAIKEKTFNGCKNLKKIELPEGLKSIESAAFEYCRSLVEITLLDGVTKIEDFAFRCCDSLSSISIPTSVKEIGTYAFDSCKMLTDISVDTDNGTYASQNGILYSKDMTQLLLYPYGKEGSFTVPDSVTVIGSAAFANCENLHNIILQEGLQKIEESAFQECIHLQTIKIPDTVTKIDSNAFDYCINLKEIDLSKNISVLRKSIFSECYALEKVTIPDGVTVIEDSAFYACENLETLIIPKSVTTIGRWIFTGCDNLRDVYYTGSKKAWKKISTGRKNDILKDAFIHYNSKVIAEAKNAVYNGKARKPKITVTDFDGNLIEPSEYTVKYTNNKNTGMATATITGPNTGTQTVYFEIQPKGTKLTRIKAVKKGITANWKVQKNQITGYELAYSTARDDSKFNKFVTVKGTTKKKITVKKLKSKKTYYVRIRTYKQIKINGKRMKIYSAWSDAKSVRTLP